MAVRQFCSRHVCRTGYRIEGTVRVTERQYTPEMIDNRVRVSSPFFRRLWALAVVAAACSGSNTPVGPSPPTPPTLPPPQVFPTYVLIGAGDIGDCGNEGGRWAEATAKLLDRNPDATIFAA